MRFLRCTCYAFFIVGSTILSPAAPTQPAIWRTEIGQEFQGELSGVYGGYAHITGKKQLSLVPVAELNDEGLDRIAVFLAKEPAQPALWKDASTGVSKELRKRLQVLKGEKLVPFDFGERPEPEFYLAYFSAHWCGPCRRFTPKLREAYRQLQEHPVSAGRFELVFVSSDENAYAQLDYAKEASMPWPMIAFSSLGSVPTLEKFAGNGIPCLVVVNRQGHLLYHSYQGEDYLGPDDPLEKFVALLNQLDLKQPEIRIARHRLAIRQHVLAAGKGELPPKPYLIALDRTRYQHFEVKKFKALLTVDEKGQVTDFRTEPALSPVSERMIATDARQWLFLPAIEKGSPKPKKLSVPIEL